MFPNCFADLLVCVFEKLTRHKILFVVVCASFNALKIDIWETKTTVFAVSRSKDAGAGALHFPRHLLNVLFYLYQRSSHKPKPHFVRSSNILVSTHFSLALSPRAQIVRFSLYLTFIPKKIVTCPSPFSYLMHPQIHLSTLSGHFFVSLLQYAPLQSLPT